MSNAFVSVIAAYMHNMLQYSIKLLIVYVLAAFIVHAIDSTVYPLLTPSIRYTRPLQLVCVRSPESLFVQKIVCNVVKLPRNWTNIILVWNSEYSVW